VIWAWWQEIPKPVRDMVWVFIASLMIFMDLFSGRTP